MQPIAETFPESAFRKDTLDLCKIVNVHKLTPDEVEPVYELKKSMTSGAGVLSSRFARALVAFDVGRALVKLVDDERASLAELGGAMEDVKKLQQLVDARPQPLVCQGVQPFFSAEVASQLKQAWGQYKVILNKKTTRLEAKAGEQLAELHKKMSEPMQCVREKLTTDYSTSLQALYAKHIQSFEGADMDLKGSALAKDFEDLQKTSLPDLSTTEVCTFVDAEPFAELQLWIAARTTLAATWAKGYRALCKEDGAIDVESDAVADLLASVENIGGAPESLERQYKDKLLMKLSKVVAVNMFVPTQFGKFEAYGKTLEESTAKGELALRAGITSESLPDGAKNGGPVLAILRNVRSLTKIGGDDWQRFDFTLMGAAVGPFAFQLKQSPPIPEGLTSPLDTQLKKDLVEKLTKCIEHYHVLNTELEKLEVCVKEWPLELESVSDDKVVVSKFTYWGVDLVFLIAIESLPL